jgi:hypothetical protein
MSRKVESVGEVDAIFILDRLQHDDDQADEDRKKSDEAKQVIPSFEAPNYLHR